jgi:hypothetical protein
MKNNYSLLVITLSALLWSCSAAYKNTSTPDDLYYSPAATTKPVVATEDKYESYTTSSEDNYLKMKVQNRYQWDAIDDYSYWNDSRYDFGYSCTPSRSSMIWGWNFMPGFYGSFGFGMWSSAYYYGPTWYSWYSPYNSIVYYKSPQTYYKGTTAKTNLSAYRNYRYSNGNNDYKTSFYNNSNSNNNYYRPSQTNSTTRFFSSGSTPSSSAGGHSGGFSSAGSSAGGARVGRSH